MDTPQYQDTERICRNCGKVYTWEAGEVRYFTDRGLSPPSHCPACRKQRRAMIQNPEPIPAGSQRPDGFDPTRRWRDLYPNGDRGRP